MLACAPGSFVCSSSLLLPTGGARIAINGTVLYSVSSNQLAIGGNVNVTGDLITVSGENIQAAGELSGLGAVFFSGIGSDTGTPLVTTGASNNVKLDSSSMRYKHNVEPLVPDPGVILGAEPIRVDFIGGTKGVPGFAAEQIATIAPDLVNRDAEGRPDSLRLQGMLAYTIALLRAQDARIAALEAAADDGGGSGQMSIR